MPRFELWVLEFDAFPKFDDPTIFVVMPDMLTSSMGYRFRAFVFFSLERIVSFL